jgi:hypothetical protein
MNSAQQLSNIRTHAQQAYRRGAVADALAIQRRLLGDATAAHAVTAEDFLFLALLLRETGARADAAATVRDCLARFPSYAAGYENLGVLQCEAGNFAAAIESGLKALEHGSDSPNTLDMLCSALQREGRLEKARAYGKRSLTEKDRRFGATAPLCRVPIHPPPPFNPAERAANVIAYVLWGNAPRYTVVLSENVRIWPHLFPGWTLRVYCDQSVPEDFVAWLGRHGVQVVRQDLGEGEFPHRRLLWRFHVASDPAVRRFLVRDADSLLTVKERVAVDDWLRSDRYFHLMRDWWTHTDLMLAGMWGGVGGVLPPHNTIVAAYKGWREQTEHVDQDLLTEVVWPIARQSVLIDDSTFTGSLGSQPFPPYGALPPGHHVGQNAFHFFQRGAGRDS